MLREWTDELGKDDYITNWVSTGPKSNGYISNTEIETMKLEGCTLNYELNYKIIIRDV